MLSSFSISQKCDFDKKEIKNIDISSYWIMNFKADFLFLFIIPIILSLVFVIFFYSLTNGFSFSNHFSLLMTLSLFGIANEIPHFLVTYARTYGDPLYRNNYPHILYGSLFLSFGISMALFVIYLKEDIYILRALFSGFIGIWIAHNYYHFIKQYLGFSVIYSLKNKEVLSFIRGKIEIIFLGTGILYPLISKIATHHPVISYALYFPIPNDAWKTIETNFFKYSLIAYIFSYLCKKYSSLSSFFSFTRISAYSFLGGGIIIYLFVFYPSFKIWGFFRYTVGLIFIISAIIFSIDQLWLINKERKINLPKLLFLFFCISSTYFIFKFLDNYFLCLMALAVIHNSHYLFIGFYYQKRKRQETKKESIRNFPLMVKKFIKASLVVGLIITSLKTYHYYHASWETFYYFLSIIFFGLALHHYLLDSIIWKVRKPEENEYWITK